MDSIKARRGLETERTTYNHAQPDLLATILLLDRFVQNDVQEDIVTSQHANDLSAAVELDEQPLVEILQEKTRER